MSFFYAVNMCFKSVVHTVRLLCIATLVFVFKMIGADSEPRRQLSTTHNPSDVSSV